MGGGGGGGGGAKGMLAPLSNYWGGGAAKGTLAPFSNYWPPLPLPPPSSYAYASYVTRLSSFEICSALSSRYNLPIRARLFKTNDVVS